MPTAPGREYPVKSDPTDYDSLPPVTAGEPDEAAVPAAVATACALLVSAARGAVLAIDQWPTVDAAMRSHTRDLQRCVIRQVAAEPDARDRARELMAESIERLRRGDQVDPGAVAGDVVDGVATVGKAAGKAAGYIADAVDAPARTGLWLLFAAAGLALVVLGVRRFSQEVTS